jgi:hypothetical protein
VRLPLRRAEGTRENHAAEQLTDRAPDADRERRAASHRRG